MTLPSKRVVNIDIPEVSSFRGQFVYNFFVKDEKSNEQTQAPAYVTTRPTNGFDNKFIDKISKIVPRFVRFDFSPIPSAEKDNKLKDITIRKFFGKIQNEEKIAGKDFTKINFQESNLDNKLFFLCKNVLENKIAENNTVVQSDITAAQKKLENKLSKLSPVDRARILNGMTSDDISEELIVGALSNIQTFGARFVDEATKKEIIQQSFEDISKIAIQVNVNNKVVSQLLKTSIDDPLSSFGQQLTEVINSYELVQNETRKSTRGAAGVVSPDEYEFEIDYIKQFHIDPKGFESKLTICGYVIDKWEVLQNGTLLAKPSIIIESASTSTAVDLFVKYGTTYVYSIRTIGLLEVEAVEEDSISAVVAMMSSKPSQSVTVLCAEHVAPPPPTDFDIIWDYQAKAPRVSWSFPTNPQRDIKKFQVFKRGSIKEPFQLIKMFDFDDSTIKTINHETPNSELVEFNLNPIRHYLDEEFQKGGSCIYAVCSIDAHGLTSCYSMQFEVRYDSFTNKIVKKLISSSGAPKDYPNMFLNQDTFVDTIRVSGAERVRVIFNPEYLEVKDSTNQKLGLLATDKTGGKYRLQFINVDLQQQKSAEIVLGDRRRD